MEIFKLFGSIYVDNDKANQSIAKTGKEAEKSGGLLSEFGSIAKKVGKMVAAAFSVKAIVDFGKNCINAAQALQQTQKKTQTIFGDMASDVQEWSLANERAFGLGAGTIEGFVGSIADITQGMGMAKDASLDMAQGAMELGVQLANWNDIDASSAMEDLKKAITGGHDAVEKYGIKLNDTVLSQTAMNMGLGDNFSKLSEVEKAQVRYQAIVESSGNAIEYWNEGNRSGSFYLTETKEQIGNVCEVIGGWMLPLYEKIVKKVADASAEFALFVGKISEGVSCFIEAFNTTGDPVDALYETFKNVFGIELPDTFLDFANTFIDGFTNIFSTFKEIFDTIAHPLFEALKNVFSALLEHSGPIFEGIQTLFSVSMDYFQKVWDSIGKPVFDKIGEIVVWLSEIFAEYYPEISRIFNEFCQIIQRYWNEVGKPVFDAIGWLIKNVLAPTFDVVFNGIKEVVGNAFKGIVNLWDTNLKPILNGIIDFVKNVFAGDWKGAWKSIVNIFGNVFDGLKTLAKAPINGVISMVNGMIKGLNKIKLPDWIPGVGGKGINIPTIPMLYKGTDYFKPTKTWGNMALVGKSVCRFMKKFIIKNRAKSVESKLLFTVN